jgi:antitoxin VapB
MVPTEAAKAEMSMARLQLNPDTERLALRVAARVGCTPDALIHAALEREASARGIAVTEQAPVRKRMTVEEMLALGDRFTALPLLDERSPQEIVDELNDI